MGSLFGCSEVKLRSTKNNLIAMLDVILHHLLEIEYPRHSIHQCQHNHPEGVLHRGMLVEIVQHYLCNRIALQLNHQSHTVTIGFVTNIGNAFKFFIVNKFDNFFNQPYLIYLVWQLCNNNGFPAVFLGNLHKGSCPDNNFSSTGRICQTNSLVTIYNTSSREIRSDNIFHEIGHFQFRICNQGYHAVNNLSEVLGRDVGGHSNCNT